MNVLHMQLSGGFGGIATLSREISNRRIKMFLSFCLKAAVWRMK